MGHSLKEPTGFFHNFERNVPTTCLSHSSRVLSKNAQQLITLYSAIYSMSSLRVCGKIEPHWEFVVSSLKKTHWAHCGCIIEYSLKELLMSGSGKLWVHFAQNCERTQWVLSKSGSWVCCWFFFERTLNLPTDHIEIKVVSIFWKNSEFTCWVKCE